MSIQYKRLSSAALFSTVTLMFFAIQFALNRRADLLSLPLPTNIFTGVGVGITSIGTYHLITKVFLWLYGHVLLVRRFTLGAAYIEGTWVGHYQHGGLDRFTIEFIDQRHEETIIHGREFDENKKHRGGWESQLVSVDGIKRQLEYSYTCSMNHSKSQHQGLAHFKMIIPKAGSYAYALEGYAADLIDGDKDPNKEYKIDEAEMSDAHALDRAYEIFILHKTPIDYPGA